MNRNGGGDKLLIMMVGLPRSGKSTIASKLGFPVVCPDHIRTAIYGWRYYPNGEEHVWAVAKTMVRSLFYSGEKVVVLDSTNISRDWRARWVDDEWTVSFCPVLTSKDVCLDRARMENDEHILPVIEDMSRMYEPIGPDEGQICEFNASAANVYTQYYLPAGSDLRERSAQVYLSNSFEMNMLPEGLCAVTRRISRDEARRMLSSQLSVGSRDGEAFLLQGGEVQGGECAKGMRADIAGMFREGDRLVVAQHAAGALGGSLLDGALGSKVSWYFVEVLRGSRG